MGQREETNQENKLIKALIEEREEMNKGEMNKGNKSNSDQKGINRPILIKVRS